VPTSNPRPAWAAALGPAAPLALLALLGPLSLLAPGPAGAQALAGAAAPVTAAVHYARQPRISEMQVSPSNQHAAFILTNPDGQRVVATIDLTEPGHIKALTGRRSLDVRNLNWVNERRLVFDLTPPEALYYEGEAGTFGIDIDGQRLELLADWSYNKRRTLGSLIPDRVLPYGWAFAGALPGRGDQALFSYRPPQDGTTQRYISALARLDTATGRLERVSDGMPENPLALVADAAGDLRIAVTGDGGRARVHHRPAGSRTWQVLEDTPLIDGQRLNPLYIEADGKWIVSSRQARDTLALYVYDPKTRRLDPEPLVAVDGFDIDGGLEVDERQPTLVGVHILTSRPQTVWLDARLQQIQKAVDAALPAGRTNQLLCGHCPSAQRFVVRSMGDRMPAEYHVFDVAARRLVAIGTSHPDLPEASQGHRSFHRVPARDGLSLPVVVTHPAGVPPTTPRPLVVLVHGGPHVRGGSLLWSAEAQFLAAQGWRVLEVEYRGSTGFGERHFRAGFKQWGQAMQDDLADAVAWAVREKLGEPGRACIVGGSYGGYAALMGPVRHPELYRCAASLNGVTDTTRLFSRFWTDITEQAQRYVFTETLGDPVADKAMLERFSPLNRVADIKVPLLVTWGARDTRVDPAQSRRFVAAARAAGVVVETHEYLDEGHSLFEERSRVDHLERLARFIGRHLGPPAR
jgi:dipeptidyl aminopeptidase/acylaminoacyl peptidase